MTLCVYIIQTVSQFVCVTPDNPYIYGLSSHVVKWSTCRTDNDISILLSRRIFEFDQIPVKLGRGRRSAAVDSYIGKR